MIIKTTTTITTTTGQQATLNLIDNLANKDLGTQSSQLISIQQQIYQFPSRILLLTILPVLNKICKNNISLWIYALPIHKILAEKIPIDQYRLHAGTSLAEGLSDSSR